MSALILLMAANRHYALTCSPSQSLVDSAYSPYPLAVALGIGLAVAIQLIIVVLTSSCLELRSALRRSQELQTVRTPLLVRLC